MGDEERGASAALAAPLLQPPPAAAAEEESCYREAGCPGCAQDRRKESSGGRIPCKELFFVGLTTLASCT
jgi:hypothetical protein